MKYTLENLAKLKAESEKTKQNIVADICKNKAEITSLENELVKASSDKAKFEALYLEKERLEKKNEANNKQIEYLRPYSLEDVLTGCRGSIEAYNNEIDSMVEAYLKKREEAYKMFINIFDKYNEAHIVRARYKEYLPEENKIGLNARDLGVLNEIKVRQIPNHAASFENIEYDHIDKGTISSAIDMDTSNIEFDRQYFLNKATLQF